MNVTFPSKILGVALVALVVSIASHSAQAQTVKAQISDIAKTTPATPQFTVKGTAKKNFTPRNWLEVEVELSFSSSPSPKDGYIDGNVDVDIYVLVKGVDKPEIVKFSQTYRNVPDGDKVAVAAYLSPASFSKLVGKKKPSAGDVEAVAVEVKHNGKTIAGDQKGFKSPKGRPWEKAEAVGELVPKHQTPFQNLFYDRYLEPASQ